MSDLNIILAQINPTVGDLAGNYEKILDVWLDNAEADFIVFPEMVTTGYPADDLLLKPIFINAIAPFIKKLIEASKDFKAHALIGLPLMDGDVLRNAAYVIGDGTIQHTIFKFNLPNTGVFDEKRYFAYGDKMPEPYTFKGHKLGLMICEDVWHSNVAAHLKAQGADILIVPNASPFQIDKVERRAEQAHARIAETGLPLIYVNQYGGQDDLVFDGQSFAMDAHGTITHQLPAFEENIVSISIALPSLTSPPSSRDLIAGSPLEPQEDSDLRRNDEDINEILYKAVTLGLRDYIHKNGFKGIFLGLSGGIDSALSAVIAVDAIGADNVHCVMMPSPYTSQDSLDDAAECATLLGVKLDTIPIENGMKALDDMLDKFVDKDAGTTTFENIQSRLRGLTLMALSNETGKMVLSTGNKSEMAVGYATLYGDMCGGYNALKDLYKGRVYALSEWRNTQSPAIPERIITKAPSAELKPDQTDQDTLPPYDVLDDILECLIEKEMAIEDIPHDHATVLRVSKMLDRNEYKRRQAPPGPKVTLKAFGRDRRYPITNGF